MKKFINLTFTTSLLLPIFAFAQSQVQNGGATAITRLDNPIKFNSVSALITGVIDLVLTIAIPLLVVVFVWLGFRFIMAQGKETEITKVKKDLWYTIIGAGVVIGAKAISELLQATVSSLNN